MVIARKSICKIKDNFKQKLGNSSAGGMKGLRQAHLMAATGIFKIRNFDIGFLFPDDVCVEKLPKKIHFEKVIREDHRPVLEKFFTRDFSSITVVAEPQGAPQESQLSWEELSTNTPNADTLLRLVGEALESLGSSQIYYLNEVAQKEIPADSYDSFLGEETPSESINQQNINVSSLPCVQENFHDFSVRQDPSPIVMDLNANQHLTTSEMDEVHIPDIEGEMNLQEHGSWHNSISNEENMFAPSREILTPAPTQNDNSQSFSSKRLCDWNILEKNSITKKYRGLFLESELSYGQFLDNSQVPDTEIILSELLELNTATIKQLIKIVKSLLSK